MSSNRFHSDSRRAMFIEVELDHVYIGDDNLGIGAPMTDMAEITALRDELTRFLERNVSQR